MRLLIPVDSSPEAGEAADFAGLLHARIPGTATLLAVVHEENERAAARGQIETIRSLNPELAGAGLIVRVGKTADQIVAEANTGSYDLVVIGQRGQSRLAQMLIGNTALQVMNKSPLPLIVIHESRPSLSRILVCTSGSDYAKSNVELASVIARDAGAELSIMHVMSQVDITPSSPFRSLGQTAEWHIEEGTTEGRHLTELSTIARGHNVSSTPLIHYGLVVDEILTEARAGDYDLVVLGAHHRQGLAGFLLDDITRSVISQLRRPVLVVR